MKYNVKIVEIGAMALEFLSDDMLIIFNDNAPPELADISVIHEIGELIGEVELGDRVTICDEEYIVTAVGSEVNHTLSTMGHCSLKFDGAETAQLPGTMHLKGTKNPNIVVGKYISIES